MVGKLLQYSGLITKIRAMEGRLLTQEEYERILGFQTVDETIAYLKEEKTYGKIYSGHDEIKHRGQVEALIYDSIRMDFEKICCFCNPMQQQAVEFYEPQLQYENATPKIEPDYFVKTWKKINRFPQKDTKKILKEVFGTQIDWLNIMWIYRAKRFFRQQDTEIIPYVIPIRYKLKRIELQRMITAQSIEEFERIIENTAYFKGKDALMQLQDEVSYHQVMQRMYRSICKKYPASLAHVFYYLYRKEQEIQKLTSILEGIRYQVAKQDIRTIILEK